MDAAVRKAASEERRCMQALYDTQGTVGEGAFGVVLKAAVKTRAPTAADDGGHGDAAASADATSAAAAAGASAQDQQSQPRQFVAIKKMLNHREGQGIPQDAYREIKILKELRHENIVRLERVFTRPEKHEIDLVYEYAEHDLAEIIKTNRLRAAQAAAAGTANPRQANPRQGPTDARMLKSVMQQVLTGLAFLHKNWCMHRDMKPANLLVTGENQADGGGRVKIADFGLARIFQSPLRKLSDDGEVVTIWYRAPECLLGCKHYTRAIDVFAVGCIFYELMCCAALFPGKEVTREAGAAAAGAAGGAAAAGGRPFQEHQCREVFRTLGKPSVEAWPGLVDCPHYGAIKGWPSRDYTYKLMDRIPSGAAQGSAAARDLLERMLVYDPAKRITAEEALAHPYFREEPRADASALVDTQGARISYPARQAKPLSTSKRMREHESAPHVQAQTQAAATASAAASAVAAAAAAAAAASASASSAQSSTYAAGGRSSAPPPASSGPANTNLPPLPLSAAQRQRLAGMGSQQQQQQQQQQQPLAAPQYDASQYQQQQQPPAKLQRRA